ncbi:hypothetical protein KX75_20595 [Salmonella enterica subsp. enterica]|nr:hypothetical protein [Salmonella enterica subsp. enterica serovar Mikawasima]EDN7229267.1 thioredoxin fold domain-containing protein [Salmonella enterica subsp. enterica serovar Mikawasima]
MNNSNITSTFSRHELTINQGDTALFTLTGLKAGRYLFSRCKEQILMEDISTARVSTLYSGDPESLSGVMRELGKTIPGMFSAQRKFRIKVAATAVIAAVLAIAGLTGYVTSDNSTPLSAATGQYRAQTEYKLSPKQQTTTHAELVPATTMLPVKQPVIEQPTMPATTKPAMLTPEELSAARAALARNLKSAADRKFFTVTLSSGHARTLYVFADPECENCRIFEPALQALAGSVNIEIFPVTLIGKDRTAAEVVPLLCEPAESRAVIWRRLFDIGDGMLNIGHTDKNAPQPQTCKVGQIALQRNDKAFQIYHLPGTPTVIADDGRPVPFIALKSIPALNAFLNERN